MGFNRFEGEPGMRLDPSTNQAEGTGHESTEIEKKIGHETTELQRNADDLAGKISQLDALPDLTEEQGRSIGERIHDFVQQCKDYYDNHRDEMNARLIGLALGVVFGAAAVYGDMQAMTPGRSFDMYGNPFIDPKITFTAIAGGAVAITEAGVQLTRFASWIGHKIKPHRKY